MSPTVQRSESPGSESVWRLRATRDGLIFTALFAAISGYGYLQDVTVRGGLGPALFLVGAVGVVLAGLGTLVSVYLTRVLRRRRPHYLPNLCHLWSGFLAAAQITVVALVGLEVYYSYRSPLPETVWHTEEAMNRWIVADETMGWASGVSTDFEVEMDGAMTRLRSNKYGFCDIEQPLADGRPRILIIGDSFPFGWGADRKANLAGQLRSSLPEAQVFDASFVGWTKDQIMLSYDARARIVKPDIVLMACMTRPGLDQSLPMGSLFQKPWFFLDGGELAPREPRAAAASGRGEESSVLHGERGGANLRGCPSPTVLVPRVSAGLPRLGQEAPARLPLAVRSTTPAFVRSILWRSRFCAASSLSSSGTARIWCSSPPRNSEFSRPGTQG